LPPSRARSLLRPPPEDPGELGAFPEHVLDEGSELHRVHRAELAPWFFNSGPLWRFNPCGIRGLGACYLGEKPVAGLLETFKGMRVVDEAELRLRAHFSANLDRRLRLADCSAPAAGGFGVNGEIHTTPDYEIAQEWASAFSRAGFAGIRYLSRSDPGMHLIGYALFDRAGEAPRGRWPDGVDRPVAEDTINEAERYGLRFSPAP
jgi:hypothetical protein